MSKEGAMTAVVQWNGDLTFVGYGPRRQGVLIDGGADEGGLGIGASPMELILMGVGACACIDIVLILKKARQTLRDCVVEVSGVRADQPPRRFLEVHLAFQLRGANLSDKHVDRAVELSMTKYCSAAQTLAQGLPVTHSWKIVP